MQISFPWKIRVGQSTGWNIVRSHIVDQIVYQILKLYISNKPYNMFTCTHCLYSTHFVYNQRSSHKCSIKQYIIGTQKSMKSQITIENCTKRRFYTIGSIVCSFLSFLKSNDIVRLHSKSIIGYQELRCYLNKNITVHIP